MDKKTFALFGKISHEKSNLEVYNEAVAIETLREEVVKRLRRIEAQDEIEAWWEDKELLGLFVSLRDAGVIHLPTKATERLRWIALLCAGICEEEGFSYGNVIIPPDYLPLTMLEDYEDRYGVRVIEEVVKIRKALIREGWEAVFPG